MGLKLLQKEFKSGVVLSDVYCKIDEIGGNQETVHCRVRYYANQEARLANKDWLDEKIHSFIPNNADDSLNIFKQGYENLKLNDAEFADAIDC